MLIYLPPCFEAATHAGDVRKAIIPEISDRAKTTIAVVTINHQRLFLVRSAQELLHIAVMEMKRAWNVGRTVGIRIANIDKYSMLLVEPFLGFVNLDFRNVVHITSVN